MNNKNNIPVDVICLINKSGVVTPLKIRIENEDGSIVKGVISKILSHSERNIGGFTILDYHCRVDIDGTEQLMDLVYNANQHIWRIMGIV